MKLRNRKTGQIREFGYLQSDYVKNLVLTVDIGKDSVEMYPYESLEELNKEWNAYKPVEPLIKDEKIRKAVRAWAEANLMKKVMFEYIENEGSYFSDCSCSIRFYEDLHLTNRHEYTIEELRGEKED